MNTFRRPERAKPGNSPRLRKYNTMKQITAWECACMKGDQFWVVTSNFLGDLDVDVEEAMLKNFGQRVLYCYFLHSMADLTRLRALLDKLSQHMRDSGDEVDVNEMVTIVLIDNHWAQPLNPKSELLKDFFLCRDHSTDEFSGCELQPSSGGKGDFTHPYSGGFRLSQERLDALRETLQCMLDNKALGRVLSTPPPYQKIAGTLLFTDIEESTLFLNELPDKWRAAYLKEYDCIVAREVSLTKGTVIKGLGDGHMCLFADRPFGRENDADACRCAMNIQMRLAEWQGTATVKKCASFAGVPGTKMAALSDTFKVVATSHGFDIDEKSVAVCKRICDLCRGGHVLVTSEVRNRAYRELGSRPEDWKRFTIPPESMKGINGIDEIDTCWELLFKGHLSMESLNPRKTTEHI